MPSVNGEVVLRKWMMDKDTLGCSGQRGSQGLWELVSGDYPSFGALIQREEVHMPHFAIRDRH